MSKRSPNPNEILLDLFSAGITDRAICMLDQTGVVNSWNSGTAHFYQYAATDMVGQPASRLLGGLDVCSCLEEARIAGNCSFDAEVYRKDGTAISAILTFQPVYRGRLLTGYGFTTHKTSLPSEAANLLETINDGFIALDRELRYTYVNRRVCEMVGLRPDEMLGKKMWDLFPDAVGSATWEAVRQALETGLSVTNQDYYPPLCLWQENHIYPGEHGLSIFISDITWRKQEEAQKQLMADISEFFNRPDRLTGLMQQMMQRMLLFHSGFYLAETWLLGRDQKTLLLNARTTANPVASTFFQHDPEFSALKTGQGLPGATWSAGKVLFWTDLSHHPGFLRQEAAATTGLQSAFGIPLRHNGRLIGVLLLGQTQATRPESLNDDVLTRLGDHLGTEISRRQLEDDLQDIFEAAPDIICIVGTDRYFKKVNPAMSGLLGYSEGELLQMPIDALVHPDDLAESQARMRRFISGEFSQLYFENRYRARDGQIIDLGWTAAKSREDGILFCIAKNISEQKKAERLYQKASELARIGSWEIDLAGNQVFWSEMTAAIMGVAAGFRPVRGNAALFYTGEDLLRLNASMQSVIAGAPPFDLELEAITARKQRCWVRVLGEGQFENGECKRIYGSLQDIEVRKRAEEAANRLLEERNLILESIGDGFFSVDRNWSVQYWNRFAEEILKTPKSAIEGQNLWSVFQNALDSPSFNYYQKAMATGEAIQFEDYYEARKKWYDVSAYPSVNGLSVFFRDITARKNAEQEVEVTRKRYRDLFQLSPLPKFVFDTETLAFLDVNRAAVDHYGYSREEFLAMTLLDIRPESEHSRLVAVIKKAGRKPYYYQPGTFTHRKKTGELIQVEITSSALDYNGRPARIALAADVTERIRHMEAIEQQNQKLRDIAWMQSHVIRAPLSRIMGLISLMSTAPNPEELAEILSYIELSAHELDEVIRAITDNAPQFSGDQ